MTATARTLTGNPASPAVRWYPYVGDAPPDTSPAPHPSRTRAWAAAWQYVTTEQVLDHRHLYVTDGTVAEAVSFYLVPGQGSPYWASQEADAAVAPVWPGTVLYCGSPHAEYGGAGSGSPALAFTTATAGLELADALGAGAVVYPGLDHRQAAVLADAGRSAAPGQVLDLATDVAHTRPLGPTLDDWWAGIPARHRRDVRRQWRRGAEAGLTLQSLSGSRMLPHLPDFETLANSTAARHGTATLYGLDVLQLLAEVPGSVLLAARHEGDLVGGMYGWLYGGCLYLWAAGVAYQHPVARSVYTWLMCEAARWGISQGADRIDAGRANCRAKARLGYRPEVLRTVVVLTSPQPTTVRALTRLSRRLGEQAAPYLGVGAAW